MEVFSFLSRSPTFARRVFHFVGPIVAKVKTRLRLSPLDEHLRIKEFHGASQGQNDRTG